MDVKPGYKLTEVGAIPDDWRVTKLGDLASFKSGDGIAVSKLSTRTSHATVPVFGGNGIAGYTTQSMVTKEEIGRCASFVHDIEAYAGGDIVILRTTAADPTYLGNLLNTAPVARQKASKGQGDAVVHISASSLSAIGLTIPGLDEQIAIGTVLSDMDIEISSVEAKLAKARQIKQGMMQELLTGRIRLVQPQAAIGRSRTLAKSHEEAQPV